MTYNNKTEAAGLGLIKLQSFQSLNPPFNPVENQERSWSSCQRSRQKLNKSINAECLNNKLIKKN